MTLVESAIEFKIRLGMLIRVIGREIQPAYWVCTQCGNIEYQEREVLCWKCGMGEMIYKGKI